MSDDFVTGADLVKKKSMKAKPAEETPEPYSVQDDPDSRSYLETLCDKAKAAVLSAKDDTWNESVRAMAEALGSLAGVCKLSGRPRAQAQTEEVLMTVRVCQSVADLETANIIPELDRVRRIVGMPANIRGAMY